MISYNQVLEYLYNQLPMYHRIGSAAYKPDIGNIVKLCQHLGNPQNKFKSIHIAGTNGKGSVSSMLASILMEQGYKTALATSPHLKDFRERIRIDGKMIPKREVVRFVKENRHLFKEISPSFFEISIALTFDYFAKSEVDIAVIETGLGGRLDSTNIILPELSVITNIGMDHANLLGNTLQKIAYEKAGIIKPQIPVVIGRHQPEIFQVFNDKAEFEGAPIHLSKDFFRVKEAEIERVRGKVYRKVTFDCLEGKIREYSCDIWGRYQTENIATALTAVKILKSNGWRISEEAVRNGLAKVSRNSGLKGRWQQLGSNPTIMADTGHNLDGIKVVMEQIGELTFEHLHMVIGMVDDKDAVSVLRLMPKTAKYYFCKPNIPRGLDAVKLQEQGAQVGVNGIVYESVTEAFYAAKENATRNDLIFVGGSTFVVAEVV
jgi:dihydrofolate synthase/folylpolyglutamate synthase